jgi:transposase
VYLEIRIGEAMAVRKPKAKRMSARTVDDEDYQLRHERVAGIEVAKASGMVCLRLPPEPGKARRSSRTWEVTATVPEIAEAAAELRAAGVELVSMESTLAGLGAT